MPSSVSLSASSTGVLCEGQQRTYTATPIGQGAGIYSYNWPTAVTGLTILSRTGNQMTVTPAPGFSGQIVIPSFTATGLCGAVPAFAAETLTVSSLPPRPGIMTRDVEPPLCLSNALFTPIRFTIPATPGATTYRWILKLGTTVLEDVTRNAMVYLLEADQVGTYNVAVFAVNDCGQSTLSRSMNFQIVATGGNCGGPRSRLAISPNPVTSGQLIADLVPAASLAPAATTAPVAGAVVLSAAPAQMLSSEPAQPATLPYRLLDQSGTVVRTGTFNGTRLSVPTDGLKFGIYTLVVFVDGEAQQAKVVIQR